MKKVMINTQFITLGQFLKFVNVIGSGAEAKYYLQANKVFVNNDIEIRRGRKLFNGDVIIIGQGKYQIRS